MFESQELFVRYLSLYSEMYGLLRILLNNYLFGARNYLQTKKCLSTQEIFVSYFLSSSEMFGLLRILLNKCLSGGRNSFQTKQILSTQEIFVRYFLSSSEIIVWSKKLFPNQENFECPRNLCGLFLIKIRNVWLAKNPVE
jgi:hypothetical protein